VINRYISGFTVAAALLVASISTAMAAGNNCMPIGGIGMLNFVPQPDSIITIVM